VSRPAEGLPPTLVVAIGNRFRRDDGVAPAVLDELHRRSGATLGDGAGVGPLVELVELDGEPTRLLDAWEGRSCAVVLDAVHDPTRAPGEVVVLDGGEELARWDAGCSSHSGGLVEALRLGQALRRLPDRVVVVGVVVGDLGDGPGLSPPVRAAVPLAADASVAAVAAGAPVGGEHGKQRHVPG
jgi:hydrogenase maturation protease